MSSPLSAPCKKKQWGTKADSKTSASANVTPSPENGGNGRLLIITLQGPNHPEVSCCKKQEGCGQDLNSAAAQLTGTVLTAFDLLWQMGRWASRFRNAAVHWNLFRFHRDFQWMIYLPVWCVVIAIFQDCAKYFRSCYNYQLVDFQSTHCQIASLLLCTQIFKDIWKGRHTALPNLVLILHTICDLTWCYMHNKALGSVRDIFIVGKWDLLNTWLCWLWIMRIIIKYTSRGILQGTLI